MICLSAVVTPDFLAFQFFSVFCGVSALKRNVEGVTFDFQVSGALPSGVAVSATHRSAGYLLGHSKGVEAETTFPKDAS